MVEDIQRQHGYESIGDAFASLTYSLIFDVDYDAIELDEIVDGKQDKQIDIIRIEDDPDRGYAEIHIIQSKLILSSE